MERMDLSAVKTAWRALDRAQKAVKKARDLAYESVADALPDPPPEGGRLGREDRQAQRDLVKLTDWSRPHLRKVWEDVRLARAKAGKQPQLLTPEKAVAALVGNPEKEKPGRAALLKLAEEDEKEAREHLADEILKVVPYGLGTGVPVRAAAYEELTRITGYNPRHLDRLRAEAAQRTAKKGS